jgi:hypothetical protein
VTGFSRGGALVETALVVGIALMVLLSTLQLGALGFKQTAQDGAVFVAAHTYAQSPALGVPRATSAANSAFGTVPASAITVTPIGSVVTATVSTTASAPSVPGAPSSITLRSGATERFPSSGTPGAFSVTATLSNYRNANGTPTASHPLVVAQPGLPSGNCDQTGENEGCTGNHQYSGPAYTGPSAEYNCRLAAYNGLTFPSSRPKGRLAGPGTDWDPASSTSPLNAIYTWDGGTGCA